jgi:hypothetical protein
MYRRNLYISRVFIFLSDLLLNILGSFPNMDDGFILGHLTFLKSLFIIHYLLHLLILFLVKETLILIDFFAFLIKLSKSKCTNFIEILKLILT